MKNKILFIVEGRRTESSIITNAERGLVNLMDADCEIVKYETSIYELYKKIKDNSYDDIVAYLRSESRLNIDDSILSKTAFSAIYLIFDYDPQYQSYSDESIREMLEMFDDETNGLGKLYINYPMVESFFHLKNYPDGEYNDRIVSLENLTSSSYKSLVLQEAKIYKNRLTKNELKYIIMHNYNKSKFIDDSADVDVDYMAILNKQIDKKNTENKIYVLNTLALMPLDYNMQLVLDKLNLDFQDGFIQV